MSRYTLPPELREQFLRLTAERLAELRGMRRALEANPGDVTALNGIFALAHKVAGTAASFGFDRLGACAEELEAIAEGGDAQPGSRRAASDPRYVCSLSKSLETEIETVLCSAGG